MALKRRRSITADERKLWRSAMRDATPLKPQPASASEPSPLPVLGSAGSPQTKPAAPPPAVVKPVLAPNLSLDRRTEDKLRKGRVAIQARLDLHGMTQAQAHSALIDFVLSARHAGRRAVLVITGKGAIGPGGGILRRAVPRWLHEAPLRQAVLALHEARPKDGGEGALYLLLRKPRPG